MLGSHLGRPDGQVKPEYSLEPVAARLAELLGIDVALADEPVGDGARKVVSDLRDGQIAMLENLRFHPGEEANDEQFARTLASYCDVYVNDAFGTAHRAHASTAGHGEVRRREGRRLRDGQGDRLPVAAARRGRSPVRRRARRRQGVRQDRGARRAARARQRDRDRRRDGEHVPRGAGQDARQEQGREGQARRSRATSCARRARRRSRSTCRPTSWSATGARRRRAPGRSRSTRSPPTRWRSTSGPRTVESYRRVLAAARTVFWNGPMGVFEKPKFAAGTRRDRARARRQQARADRGRRRRLGRGDRAGRPRRQGHPRVDRRRRSLEFVQGLDLPGIAALRG